MELTGDPLTDALIGPAFDLIAATRDDNPAAVAEAFRTAQTTAAQHSPHCAADTTGLATARALAILLAGMVPDDRRASDLLLWRQHPAEYRELRTAGYTADTAATLAAEWAHSTARGAA